MTKEIKKDYCFLDLPYSATEEDVKLNEKASKGLKRRCSKSGRC